MGPADETRRHLIEAATRGFAEHGVISASLLEITRQAGQRNRGAVHYHFGSRTGMLVAVLDQHPDVLAARERELLTVARARPDDDLVSAVDAFVRPPVELAAVDGLGRCYLMIVGQLIEADPAEVHPDAIQALVRTGGYEVYTLIESRLPPLPEVIARERLRMVTAFVLRAIGDRSRAVERSPDCEHLLSTEAFASNLVAMVVGMLTAAAPAV